MRWPRYRRFGPVVLTSLPERNAGVEFNRLWSGPDHAYKQRLSLGVRIGMRLVWIETPLWTTPTYIKQDLKRTRHVPRTQARHR